MSKPTKAELMAAAKCCMSDPRKCLECPSYYNEFRTADQCAADLLVKIAVRIPDDKVTP